MTVLPPPRGPAPPARRPGPPPPPPPPPPATSTGIIANQLVCLAVWLANSARDATGKIVGIYM